MTGVVFVLVLIVCFPLLIEACVLAAGSVVAALLAAALTARTAYRRFRS